MIVIQPTENSYAEYLDLARENGLGFELMDFAFPATLDDRLAVTRLIGRYTDAPVFSFHGPFISVDFSGGDEKIFEASALRITQCAAIARRLGVKRIVLHSCFFPILKKDDPLYDIWSEKGARLFHTVCSEFGVELLIENVLDRDPDIILRIMKAAAPASVGVCFDVSHANLSPTPQEEWFKILSPYIRHIHLSDNFGRYDDHEALGDGCIDFSEINMLIGEYCDRADFTIEVNGIGKVKRSLDFLKKGGMTNVR